MTSCADHGKRHNPKAWKPVAGWSCAGVPFVFLIAVVRRHYLDYPFADQFHFIPLLDKAFTGTLTWGDLWAAHNHHRLFFPRWVMTTLATRTHWDLRYEVAVNVILGAGIFLWLSYVLLRSAKLLKGDPPYLLLPLVALLVFSLNQWCNWVWGWQMQIFMAVWATTAGIAMLASPKAGHLHVAGALLLGLFATFSFGSGMVYWPAGLAVLVWPLFWKARVRGVWLVLWCAVAASVLVLYVLDLEALPHTRHNPATFLAYVLVYLGANVTLFRPWAALPAGIGALGFAAWAHWSLVRARRIPAASLAPFTALMLYAVATALLTALKRASWLGPQQAAAPRYCTVSMLFWVGVVYLLWLMTRTEPLGTGWVWRWRYRRQAARLALAAVTCLTILSSRQGFYSLDEHTNVYEPEVRRLVLDDLDELPPRLNPTGAPLREELAILKQRRLAVFRPEWAHAGKREKAPEE